MACLHPVSIARSYLLRRAFKLFDDREQQNAMLSLAIAAARNNAAWVDAVARSHGVATRCDAAAWRADGEMPPLFLTW